MTPGSTKPAGTSVGLTSRLRPAVDQPAVRRSIALAVSRLTNASTATTVQTKCRVSQRSRCAAQSAGSASALHESPSWSR